MRDISKSLLYELPDVVFTYFPGLIVRDRSVRVFSGCDRIHLAVACFNLTPLESSSTRVDSSFASSSFDSSVAAGFELVPNIKIQWNKVRHSRTDTSWVTRQLQVVNRHLRPTCLGYIVLGSCHPSDHCLRYATIIENNIIHYDKRTRRKNVPQNLCSFFFNWNKSHVCRVVIIINSEHLQVCDVNSSCAKTHTIIVKYNVPEKVQ